VSDAPPSAPGTWGACPFCGAAVPPTAKHCPMCGDDAPVRARDLPSAPKSVRRRIQMTGALRGVIVAGVSIALAVSIITSVLQGPPVVPDPLTTAGTYALGPGNTTVIDGEITGGDFVLGNYTVMTPPGVNVTLNVYNSTQWTTIVEGGLPGPPQWSTTPGPNEQIIYSAPYTDTFYFVFGNPYPISYHLTIEVYILTQYESNVASDGFGD
jgi:hypothetical protein